MSVLMVSLLLWKGSSAAVAASGEELQAARPEVEGGVAGMERGGRTFGVDEGLGKWSAGLKGSLRRNSRPLNIMMLISYRSDRREHSMQMFKGLHGHDNGIIPPKTDVTPSLCLFTPYYHH